MHAFMQLQYIPPTLFAYGMEPATSLILETSMEIMNAYLSSYAHIIVWAENFMITEISDTVT